MFCFKTTQIKNNLKENLTSGIKYLEQQPQKELDRMESKSFLALAQEKKECFCSSVATTAPASELRASRILSAASEDDNGDSASAAVPSDTGRQGQANNRK